MTQLVLALGMVVLAGAFLLHLATHAKRDRVNRDIALRMLAALERSYPQEEP